MQSVGNSLLYLFNFAYRLDGGCLLFPEETQLSEFQVYDRRHHTPLMASPKASVAFFAFALFFPDLPPEVQADAQPPAKYPIPGWNSLPLSVSLLQFLACF